MPRMALVLKPFPYWCKLSDGFQLQWLTEGLSETHPTRVTVLFGWSQTSNGGSYTYILASERVILSSQSERASPFLILHHVLLTRTSWKSVCRGSSGIVAGGTGAKPSSDTGMFPERKISLWRELMELAATEVLFKVSRWPGVGRGGGEETSYKTEVI